MPKHYKVQYFSYTGYDDCDNKSSVTVELVQDNIAERELDDESSTQYVDWVNFYLTPATAGGTDFPSGGFDLLVHKGTYSVETDPTPVITEPRTGGKAAIISPTSVTLDGIEYTKLTFTPVATDTSDPDTLNTTTVFEFGTGTPGTKLKVKVKKQQSSFTC